MRLKITVETDMLGEASAPGEEPEELGRVELLASWEQHDGKLDLRINDHWLVDVRVPAALRQLAVLIAMTGPLPFSDDDDDDDEEDSSWEEAGQ